MMEKLIARGEQIARDAQEGQVRRVAEQLRSLFGSGAINVTGTQVLVGGRGLIKRWLFEPRLRFLGRGLK